LQLCQKSILFHALPVPGFVIRQQELRHQLQHMPQVRSAKCGGMAELSLNIRLQRWLRQIQQEISSVTAVSAIKPGTVNETCHCARYPALAQWL
jgi:hypothetical protein